MHLSYDKHSYRTTARIWDQKEREIIKVIDLGSKAKVCDVVPGGHFMSNCKRTQAPAGTGRPCHAGEPTSPASSCCCCRCYNATGTQGLMTARYIPNVGNNALFFISAGQGQLHLLDSLSGEVKQAYDAKVRVCSATLAWLLQLGRACS
jgi:hypothetical protein